MLRYNSDETTSRRDGRPKLQKRGSTKQYLDGNPRRIRDENESEIMANASPRTYDSWTVAWHATPPRDIGRLVCVQLRRR